jgi:PAS domain S-box-containing protein
MSGKSRFTPAALEPGWLEADESLHRQVVEQAPDAVIFADREGIIRIWNARAEALFGYASSEAVGHSLDLIIPEHLRAAHWRGYHQAIAAGHTRLGDKAMLTRATHKDGSKLYVELAFGIVSDTSGATLGALATGRRSAKP